MKFSKRISIALVFGYLPAAIAVAQVSTPMATQSPSAQPMAVKRASGPGRHAPFGQIVDAVEIRPIFNTERAIISLPIGLGVSTETEIRGKWSWTAELDHFQLGDKVLGRGDGFYVQDIPFERRSVKATTALGGLRYYADPSGESIYAGARVGFRRVDGSYGFGNSDVLEVAHYAPLILESGYRVVVSDQMAVRIGARVSRDFALSQQLQNKKKAVDSPKLAALRYNYESILDLGFGYYF